MGEKSLGVFPYDKVLDESGVQANCEVRVFPLLVTRQSEVWPESGQRAIQWVGPSKAVSLVTELGLKKLVATFARRKAAAANKSAP